MNILVGTRLGRYEIRLMIGEGAMGKYGERCLQCHRVKTDEALKFCRVKLA